MRILLSHKRAVIAGLAVLGLGLTATYAAFTDTSETTTTITAGTVDIVLGDDVSDGSPVMVPIEITAQPDGQPGWSSSQAIRIRNTGTLPAVITAPAPTVTDLAGSGLADQIHAELRAVADPGHTTSVGSGVLDAGTASTIGVPSGSDYTVRPGADVTLTLELSTPGGLPNAFQYASTRLDWVFTATTA